ncbi:mandelate racemase/muconate lactonizing enzyme family protein [Natrarchaeobius oligotrophus]|uniref:glucarate dehydratase n=1 Tax=Natrarchaeobius chitinivorans TaxID=1679083 RepID=A0A3N6MEX8_NATCH|nr:mandelate racemase/muconate lactonizing enzyme family protein [Natrarchaeobius chitinivorans]RQH01418.1 N-acylamino acid racemase [Natrarchaeobius chitinivorans]
MEITDVEAYAVNVDVVDVEDGGIAPYVTNHGAVEDMDRILVRVDTDEGISGWGEMRVFLSPEVTITTIEKGIAPIVTGRSPFEVESLRRLLFVEYTNVDMFFSAVEVACWDIVGKALEKPVYELLGGWTAPGTTSRRIEQDYEYDRAVDVAYCVGILSPEESRVHARRALENGYGVLKTKAGRDWRSDVERIVAMHDEVDGRLDFRLDPNQGWRLDEAVRVGASLADAGIYLQYMEQPIRVDSHESLARLRERTCQPIGPNEDTYVAHNLRRLIEDGALDVAVVDMTPAGGITGIRQLAAIAEDAGIPLAHHCAFDLGIRTAAILHAVSGIPGFSLPPDSVYYAWEDDVIEDPFVVEDGAIDVPQQPGLGVTVDEEKLERYRIS